MVRMIVTAKELRYGGVRYERGAEFEAKSAKDAKLLKAISKADDLPASAPVRHVATMVAPVAAVPAMDNPDEVAGIATPIHRYRTRRLKAED